MATSAQAATTWGERGVVRTTEGAAKGDFGTTEAQCRRNDGIVVESHVVWFTVGVVGGKADRFYAYTECRSKRG